MGYPKWVFNIREDVTRENMRIYDKQQELLRQKCLEINPNYYSLGFREKRAIRERAKGELK